jgi:hypothetical protein
LFFHLLFSLRARAAQNLVTHVGNTAPQDALAQAAQLELGQNPNALAIRRPFDPTAHELEANFRLTRLVSFIKEIAVLRIWIRDPVRFLTPGSGSGMNNPDHISESLETKFFLVGMGKFGSVIRDRKNSDP